VARRGVQEAYRGEFLTVSANRKNEREKKRAKGDSTGKRVRDF
jgi:hypothetical protein